MRALLRRAVLLSLALGLPVGACAPTPPPVAEPTTPPPTATVATAATPLPTRTLFPPGELLPYRAHSGDTLPALASHFNTTVDEIRAANPELPDPVTTLPAGYYLQIPAYHLPLTGTPFKIVPNSEVPFGPTALEFDLRSEVLGRPGYLSSLSDYAFGRERESWQVVETVARNYSIHPRLLLTLLEHQTQALTKPFPQGDQASYPMGLAHPAHTGLHRQLLWTAERLNDGFYGWRTGRIREFETLDGFLVRPDPWQNAGTVAIQYLFAGMLNQPEHEIAIGPSGFYQTYMELWGDPFSLERATVPGNLQQPELALPFLPNRVWDFSGGPHSSWGDSLPWGALDFAPPAVEGGCSPSGEWVAAPADGVVVRSEMATVVLDLDGDADERTGWVLVFFHMATDDRIAAATEVQAGDRLGHPSCEGGRSSGTHFHLARRFNGEWIPAAGPLAFNLDRWVAHGGEEPYVGELIRGSRVVPASSRTTQENQIIYELPKAADSQ